MASKNLSISEFNDSEWSYHGTNVLIVYIDSDDNINFSEDRTNKVELYNLLNFFNSSWTAFRINLPNSDDISSYGTSTSANKRKNNKVEKQKSTVNSERSKTNKTEGGIQSLVLE